MIALAHFEEKMNQFITHWEEVDETLPDPFVLVDEDEQTCGIMEFSGMRTTFTSQRDAVLNTSQDEELERAQIRLLRAELLVMANAFNGQLIAYWSKTRFAQARELMPNISDGRDVFNTPMTKIATLWQKINAAPAPPGVTLPLVLGDGTTQADFVAKIAELGNSYVNEDSFGQDLVMLRADRDETRDLAYSVMKNYRTALPGKAMEFPTLVSTMPRISPLPGHTPDPVSASGTFVPPNMAQITHTTSSEPTLARMELRGNPGSVYSHDEAIILGTHLPGDPPEFITNFGLSAPGMEIATKVYVVLETDNEAGSDTVVIRRPSDS